MHECGKSCINSIEIGRAALRIALTSSRVEETKVKERLAEHGIRSTAVDFGGEFIPSIVKIVERAVVAAQRQGLVTESHVGAGAVAGAAHEALEQVKVKAFGFSWQPAHILPALRPTSRLQIVHRICLMHSYLACTGFSIPGLCSLSASPQFCYDTVQESLPVIHRLRLSTSP